MKYIDAEKLVAEIERLKSTNPSEYNYQNAEGYTWALDDLLSFIDNLSEEPDKSLEEEVKNYFQGYWPGTETAEQCNTDLHFTPTAIIRLARHFAEWQKEQDQPITGNSLEQEWLRYIDRKKKECGGELPALGEYGWLQIARHFAEWQKKQIPMPEDTVIFQKGVEEGKRLMMEGAMEGEVHPDDCEIWVNLVGYGYKFNDGDKVRLIVLPKED